MIAGPIAPTVAVLEELAAAGVPLWALTNWSAETFALVRHDPAYALPRPLPRHLRLGRAAPGQARPGDLPPRAGRDRRPRAASCLFIDDAPKNVAAAEAIGMRGHRFTDASRACGASWLALGLLDGA